MAKRWAPGRLGLGHPGKRYGFHGNSHRFPLSTPFAFDELERGSHWMLQAVVNFGDRTHAGQLIRAVAIPWFSIVRRLQISPESVYELDWRKWEEIIAGAYKAQGFEVVLTPRSNDKGRDIIATTTGIGSIKFFEQVKAYKPGHLVDADDIRAMVGVLALEGNVSKGIVTTTSDFAPGIAKDESIQRLVPYRLELKPRQLLLEWLADIAANKL